MAIALALLSVVILNIGIVADTLIMKIMWPEESGIFLMGLLYHLLLMGQTHLNFRDQGLGHKLSSSQDIDLVGQQMTSMVRIAALYLYQKMRARLFV